MMPTKEEFEELMRKSGGNLTKAARLMGMTRQAVWGWTKKNPEFAEILKDERMRVFDKCLEVAYAVAMGIPRVDSRTQQITGWVEKPDGNMLRYLLSTLGREEGFGERQDIHLDNALPTTINIVMGEGGK